MKGKDIEILMGDRDINEGVVQFKSNPDMWHKELIGDKPNTVRQIDEEDIRFKKLREGCPVVILFNTVTGSSFSRKISDYTEFKGFGIISWRGLE